MPVLQEKSSAIDRAVYNKQGNSLTITYRDGAVYRYRHVPERVYLGLLEAESKGEYLNRVVKRYPYKKLAPGGGVEV